ncbi:plasmid mobilization relaxosome protein MobC [Streptomyces sp. NRRL F-5065]|uniref:plasmid mobilization relaxosome protein MobC n=1 Tax=Streptomyces sp. NRRL F-5065 TaxID=1463855 RepID=UPI00099D8B7D|nr:plasmid mobilization relaxosome protein MobC [Streptomyces sp. NRRL F-5065]
MSTDEPPRTHRRARKAQRRTHRVNLAYDDVEYGTVQVAATLAGLRVAAYAARAALAVAKEEVRPLPADEKERMRTFVDARIAVDRIGTNVNQIAKVLNSQGDETAERINAVLARAEQAIMRLDEATIAVLEGRL